MSKSPSKRARSPSPAPSFGSDAFSPASPVRMQLKNTFLHLTLAEGHEVYAEKDVSTFKRSKSLGALDGMKKSASNQILFDGEYGSEHSFHMVEEDDTDDNRTPQYAASDAGLPRITSREHENHELSEDLEFNMTGFDDEESQDRSPTSTRRNLASHRGRQQSRDKRDPTQQQTTTSKNPHDMLAHQTENVIKRLSKYNNSNSDGFVSTNEVLKGVWGRLEQAGMETPAGGFSIERFSDFMRRYNQFEQVTNSNGTHQVRLRVTNTNQDSLATNPNLVGVNSSSTHVASPNQRAVVNNNNNVGHSPLPPMPNLSLGQSVATQAQQQNQMQQQNNNVVNNNNFQNQQNQQQMYTQQQQPMSPMHSPMQQPFQTTQTIMSPIMSPRINPQQQPPQVMTATPVLIQSPRGVQQGMVMTPVTQMNNSMNFQNVQRQQNVNVNQQNIPGPHSPVQMLHQSPNLSHMTPSPQATAAQQIAQQLASPRSHGHGMGAAPSHSPPHSPTGRSMSPPASGYASPTGTSSQGTAIFCQKVSEILKKHGKNKMKIADLIHEFNKEVGETGTIEPAVMTAKINRMLIFLQRFPGIFRVFHDALQDEYYVSPVEMSPR